MIGSRLSKEFHHRIFELTLALYRVTDFFPKGESIGGQLRKKANDVFGSALEYDYARNAEECAQNTLVHIQSLKGFLRLCRSLKYVKPINLVVLEREYEFISNFFEREIYRLQDEKKDADTAGFNQKTIAKDPINEVINTESPQKKAIPKKEEVKTGQPLPKVNRVASENHPIEPNERQRAIIEHLKQQTNAKISDFFDVFGNISSKTIQRDLQDLVQKNILRREGEKRWTQYTLKVHNV